jgi:Flp pilus assembly protein TadG
MTASSRPQGFLSRFRGDRRGVSAVEFALLAPVMITFYFGLAEFCQGYMSQKRVSHTASAIADIVAQTSTVTKDQLDDMMALSALVMKPFATTTLTTRVTSVTRNAQGVAKVDWSRATNTTPLKTSATVTVPADLIANGESLIMAETTYDYSSPVKYVLPNVVKFSNVFYLRPRQVEMVPCTDCPTT